MPGDFYTDAEVDALCDGLTQHAAMVRHLRRLGLRVDRKPNGRPLAWRPEPPAGQAHNAPHSPLAPPQPAGAEGVVIGLQGWAANRKQQQNTRTHGQKAQGR